MKWYFIFILSSIPSLALSIYELKKHSPSKKNFYFYLLLSSFIGITINLVYTPIDHYESEKQTQVITTKNLQLTNSIDLHERSIKTLNEENILLKQKNDLLQNNIFLVESNLETYKKQISQFSIEFKTNFTVNSMVNIAKEGLVRGPLPIYASLITENNEYIYFQTADANYRFVSFPVQNQQLGYYFSINSEVRGAKSPIGKPTSFLSKFTKIELYIPVFQWIDRKDLVSRTTLISFVDISFIINGVPIKKHLISSELIKTTLGDSIYFPDSDWICIKIPIKGNFYNFFQLAKN